MQGLSLVAGPTGPGYCVWVCLHVTRTDSCGLIRVNEISWGLTQSFLAIRRLLEMMGAI